MKNCFDTLPSSLMLIEQEFANKAELAKRIPDAKTAFDKYTVALIIYVKDWADHDRR